MIMVRISSELSSEVVIRYGHQAGDGADLRLLGLSFRQATTHFCGCSSLTMYVRAVFGVEKMTRVALNFVSFVSCWTSCRGETGEQHRDSI